MSLGDNVVDLRGVSVVYPHAVALHDLTLQVHEGELLGILGHNGAGKTTLLRTILGLVAPQRGEVYVLGQRLLAKTARSVRQQISYVPQQSQVDPKLPISAWDVVMMGRYGRLGLLRSPRRHDRELVDSALKQVGCLHLASRPFGQLSGGQQQRVLIARAIAQQARLLLMDEPTNSVDFHMQLRLAELITRLHHQQQLTSIIVSHDARFLKAITTRIAVMTNGRITGEHTPPTAMKTLLEVSDELGSVE